MPCTHKFWNDPNHLTEEKALLPNWVIDTLFIGTFNPSLKWNVKNNSVYFYGRTRNYLYKLMSRLNGINEIEKSNKGNIISFLKKNKIGLTDILISIQDADFENQNHRTLIKDFTDKNLESFKKFQWNTEQIKSCIKENNIKTVFFTRKDQTGQFGYQMKIIENYCIANKIKCYWLFTPSGQGLGKGKPRINKLINVWYDTAKDDFHFISPDFDIKKYKWSKI